MDERRPVVMFFDSVPDPRVERTRRHKLVDILLIVLIGTICDCKGWDALHEFAEQSDEFLGSLLELPHGVPVATSRIAIQSVPGQSRDATHCAWHRAKAQTSGWLQSLLIEQPTDASRGSLPESGAPPAPLPPPPLPLVAAVELPDNVPAGPLAPPLPAAGGVSFVPLHALNEASPITTMPTAVRVHMPGASFRARQAFFDCC